MPRLIWVCAGRTTILLVLSCRGSDAAPYFSVARKKEIAMWLLYCSFLFSCTLPGWQNSIWAATRENQQCGCAPSADSDQPGHPPSLIRVYAVRMKVTWTLNYRLSAKRRVWSAWVDAQADLTLRWAYNHFVGFLLSRLNYDLGKYEGGQ